MKGMPRIGKGISTLVSENVHLPLLEWLIGRIRLVANHWIPMNSHILNEWEKVQRRV